jgi:hypothetical protein
MQAAVDEKEDDTAAGNEADIGSQSSLRQNVDLSSNLTSTDETGGNDDPGQPSTSVGSNLTSTDETNGNDDPGQPSTSVANLTSTDETGGDETGGNDDPGQPSTSVASLSSANSAILPAAQHLISNTSTNQALSILGHTADSSPRAPGQIMMPSNQLLNGASYASLPQTAIPAHFAVHMPHFMNGAASLHTLAKAADAIDNPPTSSSAPFRRMTLYLEQDKRNLSPYQRLARKQIELFEANEKDLEDNAQGRNRPICLRQVGIRCLHCGKQPAKERTKGSVFFPSRLVGVYQTAQNMASSHFAKDCKVIPKDIREDLLRIRLKDTKLRKSSHGGGREYWASCLRVLGVVETPDRRLCFSSI